MRKILVFAAILTALGWHRRQRRHVTAPSVSAISHRTRVRSCTCGTMASGFIAVASSASRGTSVTSATGVSHSSSATTGVSYSSSDMYHASSLGTSVSSATRVGSATTGVSHSSSGIFRTSSPIRSPPGIAAHSSNSDTRGTLSRGTVAASPWASLGTFVQGTSWASTIACGVPSRARMTPSPAPRRPKSFLAFATCQASFGKGATGSP